MDADNLMTQDQQTRKELSATDYAAFSAAAYSEYSLKDLNDRAAATRNRLKGWGVGEGWHIIENPVFANETFTTFINTDTMPHRVVISARGTDPKNVGDLASDVDIASNKNTTGGLQRRVDMVRTAARILTGQQRFPVGKAGNTVGMPVDLFMAEDIIFTGHSLGGAIAAQAALQSDMRAVVYNMGSSPFAQIDRTRNNTTPRNYDNVVHFTTNRVKDNVLDPVSVSQYADRPGSGIHTISYKVADSVRSLNPITNHSIDMFKRSPSDAPETGGHDILYDEAVHTLKHSYKYNDRGGGSPNSNDGSDRNRVYADPDIGTVLKNGIIQRMKQQAIALAKAKAAQAAAAAKKRSEHDSGWSWAHIIGGIAGVALLIGVGLVTGGFALAGAGAAAGIFGTGAATAAAAGSFALSAAATTAATAISAVGAATIAVTTIGDDIANWNEKSVGELILDGVGIAALGVGAAIEGVAAARNAYNIGKTGYSLIRGAEGLDEAIELGLEANLFAEAGAEVAQGEDLLNLSKLGMNPAGEIEMQTVVTGELGEAGEAGFLGGEAGEFEGEADDLLEIFDDVEGAQDVPYDPNEPLDLPDPYGDADQTVGHVRKARMTRDLENMVARSNQGKKLSAIGASAVAYSEGIGLKRKGEDDQDNEARKRRPGDRGYPGRDPNKAPSAPPGTHMDHSERVSFVSHEDVTPRFNHSNEDVDDVPTAQLQFASKSLMSGRGVDITTQIPMVTAAKGNYLRKLAEVSSMF